MLLVNIAIGQPKEKLLYMQNQNWKLIFLNNVDLPVEKLIPFPFYISALTTPAAQKPISYYIEIISNQAYETVDNVGKGGQNGRCW